MRLSLISLSILASFISTSYAAPDFLAERQQDACLAVSRDSVHQIRSLFLHLEDDEEDEDDFLSDEHELASRAENHEPICRGKGFLNKGQTPFSKQKNMSFQRCADWCRCSMTRQNCKSFLWDESTKRKGLGLCSIYSHSLNHMEFQAGDGFGEYNARKCFMKSTMTTPPTYMTTKAHSPTWPTWGPHRGKPSWPSWGPPKGKPTWAPKAKKEARAEEDVWAMAISGA